MQQTLSLSPLSSPSFSKHGSNFLYFDAWSNVSKGLTLSPQKIQFSLSQTDELQL